MLIKAKRRSRPYVLSAQPGPDILFEVGLSPSKKILRWRNYARGRVKSRYLPRYLDWKDHAELTQMTTILYLGGRNGTTRGH
jgi:hypothetical protein